MTVSIKRPKATSHTGVRVGLVISVHLKHSKLIACIPTAFEWLCSKHQVSHGALWLPSCCHCLLHVLCTDRTRQASLHLLKCTARSHNAYLTLPYGRSAYRTLR